MTKQTRWESWVASWMDIICGAISVITLCYYRPWWDFDYRAYTLKRQLKRSIARREREENARCDNR